MTAGAVVVFIRTSAFRADDLQYGASTTVPLMHPSADSAVLVASALTGLRRIYRKGYRYAKAGVMLVELQSCTVQQGVLDWGAESSALPEVARNRAPLMTVMDDINRRFGGGMLHLASAGSENGLRPWAMKQGHRSPRYTTQWDEMPVVRA